MSERIKELISVLQIKKVEFAKRLNLSQPFVSELCSGKTNPSDRTISDICREFSVNETWLRTGEGEMFRQQSRDEEMAALMGQLLADRPESFRRRLISVLLRFDPAGPEWQVLEDIYEAIKKEAQD